MNWGALTVFATVFSLLGAAATTIGGGYSLYSAVAQKSWVDAELEKLERAIDGKIAVSEAQVKAYSNNNRAEFSRETDREFAIIRENIAVMNERMNILFETVSKNKHWIDVQKNKRSM